MTDENSKNSGSFVNGFTVGILAGALGYAMFGTKRGKVVRERLAEEWEEAKQKMAEDGVVDAAEKGFGEYFGHLKSKLMTVMEEAQTEFAEKSKKDAKTKKIKKKTAKKTKRKKKETFKGVKK